MREHVHVAMIFGPPAVGKMTVAREICKKTGFKFFHNHMSIELAIQYFPFGSPSFAKIDNAIRFTVFEEIAKSDHPGFLFTFVWALNLPTEQEYVNRVLKIFKEQEAKIHYVELEAELSTRLHRNKLPDRLAEKPTKRDLERSEAMLLEHEQNHRFNSSPGELDHLTNYMKLNTTNLTSEEAAKRIIDYFNW